MTEPALLKLLVYELSGALNLDAVPAGTERIAANTGALMGFAFGLHVARYAPEWAILAQRKIEREVATLPGGKTDPRAVVMQLTQHVPMEAIDDQPATD